MQQSRRSNPYPLTWEIPLTILVAVLLILVLGVHAGRAAANLFSGAGTTWPPSDELLTSLPAVLSGDASAGLTPRPEAVAPARATQVWIAVVEIAALALMLWGAILAWVRWGPGRIHGMATHAEVERLLGRRRLRRSAKVIRPDLYEKDHR